MSGGSLDYAQYKVDDIAEAVARRAETPLHRAFAAHLLLVGQALHDLEWVWSGDKSCGDEVAAIQAVIGPNAELKQAVADAEKALSELQQAILAAKETPDAK